VKVNLKKKQLRRAAEILRPIYMLHDDSDTVSISMWCGGNTYRPTLPSVYYWQDGSLHFA